MKRQYQPVETPLGFIHGRDGIFLDEVIFRDGTSTLILVGSFNTRLCSAAPQDVIDFSDYRITFTGVLAVQIIELDSWDWDSASSFDEVLASDWIKSLGGKVTSKHRHYLVQTYDDVIEVVCENMTIHMIPASADEPAWKFLTVITEDDPLTISGVNVWAHQWHRTGEKAHVEDPHYHQPYAFDIYSITHGDTTIAFAAGEFSNGIWGFYVRE